MTIAETEFVVFCIEELAMECYRTRLAEFKDENRKIE